VVPADRCAASEVLVLVRPEAVRLAEATPGRLAGVVEELEYRGDQIEYRIRVGAMLIVAVEPTLGRHRRVAVGDRVGLQLLEDALHLLRNL